MKMLRYTIMLTLLTLVWMTVSAQEAQTPQAICDSAEVSDLSEQSYSAPDSVLEDGVDYRAVICTEAGAVYLDLYEDLTPITVNNFVFLAQNNYYDSTTFHRVLENFMAQAGDPTGTGAGGPGYQFIDEPVGYLTFDRVGLLAMANAGPGTNGSQFFITTAETPWLDFNHTIFGEVLTGYENVLALRLRDPQTNPDFEGASLNTVVIITAPSTVDAEIPETTLATQADVEVALSNMDSQLLTVLAKDSERSGLFSTDELVDSAPSAIAEDLAPFLTENNHQYRFVTRYQNADCSQEIFFGFFQVTLDNFDTADDADNALADDFPASLAEANGFSYDADSDVYAKPVDYCDGSSATHVMRLYTHGRFLVTLEGSVADSVLSQVPVNTIIVEGFQRLLDQFMAPVFRPEIRS